MAGNPFKVFEATHASSLCPRCGMNQRHIDATACIDGLRMWIAMLPEQTIVKQSAATKKENGKKTK